VIPRIVAAVDRGYGHAAKRHSSTDHPKYRGDRPITRDEKVVINLATRSAAQSIDGS
jgi:hypothetical protein